MKKLIALLLVLMMALSTVALVACGSDVPDTPDTPDAPTTPSDTPSDEPDTPDRIPLVLPERFYGKSNGDKEPFHVLEWSAGGDTMPGDNWIVWAEIDATDESGDLMSNSVFARNAYVEEKYGVEITSEYVSNGPEAFINLMILDNQTGSNLYQLSTIRSLNAWTMIETGLYLDMNDYAGEILHTDQPWWPQDSVASFTLGNSLYVSATEMLLRDKAATAAVYFNTKLAHDHGLDYFYEWVADGEWTMADMITACEIVAGDRDGDDMINTARDIWGIVNGDDPIFYLFAAAGQKFGHIDEDGYLTNDFGSAASINVMQDIFEDVMYAEWYANTFVKTNWGWPEPGAFQNDLSLFYFHMVKNSYLNLRTMETEYGILPAPKYSSDQEDYSSLVWTHHDCVVGIPSATFDPEMSAIILEALSYEGYYTVTPVLYETLLFNRMAKSAEARRSLEIIFDTRVYDPGQYWIGTGSITGKILRHTATGTTGFASLWDSYENATYAHIEKVNTFIDSTR